jgi:hypothetical protein
MRKSTSTQPPHTSLPHLKAQLGSNYRVNDLRRSDEGAKDVGSSHRVEAAEGELQRKMGTRGPVKDSAASRNGA